MTWVLEEDDPNVVATFRIEADPVVNANVIAYLGDHAETVAEHGPLQRLLAERGCKRGGYGFGAIPCPGSSGHKASNHRWAALEALGRLVGILLRRMR